MGLIKGGFSHRLASKLPVWQRSYTDHRIRDAAGFETHCHYIHQNPTRARLSEPHPWSSAAPVEKTCQAPESLNSPKLQQIRAE